MSDEAVTDNLKESEEDQHGYWYGVWRSLRRDRAALFGGILALLLIISAILASYIAPLDPTKVFTEGLLENGAPRPPGPQFWLGTDQLGRDMLSRLLWGGRISLGIGLAGNFLAVAIAVAAGTTAAYVGGVVDALIMRFIDILMAFPVLLLSVGLVASLDPSPLTIILVIAFVNWTYLARIIYNMVRSLIEREYIMAAHSIGTSPLHIVTRHILPQLVSVVVVYASLGIASAVMLEATLSYVGIGIRPPTPSWGGMINEGQRYYRTAPWLVLFPGIAIALTVLAFNLLGDGLRDALDPHTAKRRI